ncbi:hypothetical protein Tco_1003729 [Tanacetum coccineum]|uniref:Uncharacterized protein n=1 Tax=Tanacetum coccineum TaxID=301880 RepID=A0ABQ5F9W8_9ASTR
MEMKDTLSSCSNLEEQQMEQIQDKAKKSCMVSFRLLYLHLKLLSTNDLKGTRTECGFKYAFAKLFCQDVQIFTSTMFLNIDQLEKLLEKDEFQESRSMATFRVLETQCQKFIKSRISLDDEDGIMTRKYFLEYTQLEMQTIEEKVDMSKALDVSLVDTESSRTELGEQDTSSRSGNNANINPIYDEESMAEVQLTADHNVFATGQ